MNICENPTPLKCYKYIYKQLITETMSSKKHLSIFKIYSLFFSSNKCPLYFLQYLQSLLYIIYEFSLCEHIYMFICSTISLPPPHPTPTPTNCLRTPGKVLTDDLIANTFLKYLNQNILSLSLVTDPLPPVYVTVIYGIIKQTKVLNLAYFLMLFS